MSNCVSWWDAIHPRFEAYELCGMTPIIRRTVCPVCTAVLRRFKNCVPIRAALPHRTRPNLGQISDRHSGKAHYVQYAFAGWRFRWQLNRVNRYVLYVRAYGCAGMRGMGGDTDSGAERETPAWRAIHGWIVRRPHTKNNDTCVSHTSQNGTPRHQHGGRCNAYGAVCHCRLSDLWEKMKTNSWGGDLFAAWRMWNSSCGQSKPYTLSECQRLYGHSNLCRTARRWTLSANEIYSLKILISRDCLCREIWQKWWYMR